jgi:hypothetical protein
VCVNRLLCEVNELDLNQAYFIYRKIFSMLVVVVLHQKIRKCKT